MKPNTKRQFKGNRRFLRDTEVAERLGISRTSVWRWVKEGNLPSPVPLGPGTRRWALADLEHWEAQQTTKATKPGEAGDG
ncbi:MAG: helix-turn-helix transcriptional regulator [Thiohalospira sp.]